MSSTYYLTDSMFISHKDDYNFTNSMLRFWSVLQLHNLCSVSDQYYNFSNSMLRFWPVLQLFKLYAPFLTSTTTFQTLCSISDQYYNFLYSISDQYYNFLNSMLRFWPVLQLYVVRDDVEPDRLGRRSPSIDRLPAATRHTKNGRRGHR